MLPRVQKIRTKFDMYWMSLCFLGSVINGTHNLFHRNVYIPLIDCLPGMKGLNIQILV